MEYPRYTTFSPEEKERLFGIRPDLPHSGRSPLRFKSVSFSVSYPDGTEGTCLYERQGPALHRFDFRYQDSSHLDRQYYTRPLENSTIAVEEKGRELAASAFEEAIRFEQKDFFARASEPSSGSRRKDPSKYRLKAKQARELGGKYALCVAIGATLVPVSEPVETFAQAAALWGGRTESSSVIGCCNRLDRRWELLKYNPLTAHGHPRRP